MKDIQITEPEHKIAIDRVGICGLKIPISLADKMHGRQYTVADTSAFVSLPHCVKGTHMSRMSIVLQDGMRTVLNANEFLSTAQRLRIALEAEQAVVIFSFPYFVQKPAPASGLPGTTHCNVQFECIARVQNDFFFNMTVEACGTSLCPCSKEISERGAHNQRSIVTVQMSSVVRDINEFIWIEDVYNLIESEFSCPIYSVLKRPDEKHVTEAAYDNPKFVEDIVRDVAIKAQQRFGKMTYSIHVKVRNEESIHLHDAYAELTLPGEQVIEE